MMKSLCKKCKSQVSKNYCSKCGTPNVLDRINGRYILNEINRVLNFDRGILFTIRELFLRPGESVQTFIHEDRNRLVKPIIFIIITSLVYMLAQQLFHFEDGYVQAGGIEDSAVTRIFTWIQSNYGYANIFMAVFIAGWIKVFFRKEDYNFFEVLILLCFVMGNGMLIYSVFGIIESVTSFRVFHIGGLVALVYSSWAIGQFFKKNSLGIFFKGFISYLLGMLTSMILVLLLGISIDVIMAKI